MDLRTARKKLDTLHMDIDSKNGTEYRIKIYTPKRTYDRIFRDKDEMMRWRLHYKKKGYMVKFL